MIGAVGALVAVVAAEATDVTARMAGTASQLAAGLAVLAVSAVSLIVTWKLLVSLVGDPNWKSLATIVGVALGVIFLIGAAPGLVDMAYSMGQSFLVDGGGQ